MHPKWQARDLIDLEYFLNQSAGQPSTVRSPEAASSDRRLYLTYEKSHQPPFSRSELIKYWLDEKRKKAPKTAGGTGKLPGEGYSETVRLLRSLVLILALLSGAGLAWSVLSYGGTSPINIFTCIWVLLVPQVFLLTILGISAVLSRLGFSGSFKGLYPLISSLVIRLAGHAKRTGENMLPTDQRYRLYAMAGLIGRQKTLYGRVFFWPVFILAQTFGVCFNAGLLGATVLKLAITDLAFGWQSTLIPDPDTVYRMVDLFSLPWSWVSSAHPNLEQIQGSRMILKDGMIHLTTSDLVSWWPFLCLAILFYGLLPRLILLAAGIWQQRRALGRISFSTSACDRLIQRMKAPQVQSAGREYSSSQQNAISPPKPGTTAAPAESKSAGVMDPAIVFIPEDIDGQFSTADLNERIAHILGLKVINRVRFEMDPETDMAAFNAVLSRNNTLLSDIRFVILMEAWQPPIRETIAWLKSVRNTVAKDTGLIVALIGKPSDRTILTAPANTDRVIWEQAVNRLGDPFICVENLGGG